MNEDALFLTLELDPSYKFIYTQQDIKRRYHALAKLYHPDKNSKESQKFITIHNAYEQLTQMHLPRVQCDNENFYDIIFTKYNQLLGHCWNTANDFKTDMQHLNTNWKNTTIAKNIFSKMENIISWEKNHVLDVSIEHHHLGKSIKIRYDCMKLYGLLFYKETKVNIVMLDKHIEYESECIILEMEGNDIIQDGEVMTGDLVVNVILQNSL